MRFWFIDDEEEEYEKIQSILRVDETDDRNLIEHNYPLDLIDFSQNKNIEINIKQPDGIFVDYQLFNPNSERKCSNINGISIATYLRSNHSDIPIFLYSYQNLEKLAPIEEELANTIFDEILYKDVIANSEHDLSKKLEQICKGYFEINNNLSCVSKLERDDQKHKLYDLLSAPEESYDDIDTLLIWISKSPLENWTSFKIASMIRKQLMGKPGILYDSLHAATFLGISEEAFYDICSFFKDAKYSGVFSGEGDFWWKCKLMEITDSILEGDELRIPYSHGFHTAWKREKGNELDLAKCIVKGETPAEYVCHVLKKPVKIKYTLKYPVSTFVSPAMDEARISFRAIMENEGNLKLLDQDSIEIFEQFIKELRNNASK